MNSRIYSAVVDPVGPFPWQARQLVWSLTQLAGVSLNQIVLHVVNADSNPHVLSDLKRLGVEIVPVEPYPGHPYCNKLQQLQSLGRREFEDVVLLDCDVLVLEKPPLAKGGVLAKPVDFGNPSIEILTQIFYSAGLTLTLTTAEIDNTPTVLGNANGGVYVISREQFDPLSSEWKRWANWCFERSEMFGEKSMHIDQVSFAMAIASLGAPFTALERRYNVPTHVPQPQELDCNPAILHYHRAVDEQQLLLSVQGLPRVNEAIRAVNEKILSERRATLDNAVFWSARYIMHPDLGSGVGSRGTILVLKQNLLREIVRILEIHSVLDVGSGDGYTASALSEKVSVCAADLVVSSRSLYLNSVPRATWMQHDITSGPVNVDSELVVCFDVLIHMSSPEEYQSAVKNLLANGVPVLVSGYDAQPVDCGPMTYFHEPLSSTITALGCVAVPVDAYRGLTAFVAMPPQTLPSTRDISNATLIDAIPLVAEPLLLVEAVVQSRANLGFFPDHLPRCIEYPWIVQQLTVGKSMRIVDAGAGVSVLPFMLADRGHTVITVDPHSLTRNGTQPDSWNEWGFLDYSQLDSRISSQHVPYQNTSDDLHLDSVVSVSVIEHLPREIRKAWIKKAHNQLKFGGCILLTVDTVPFSRALWNYSEGNQVEDPGVHGNIEDLASELTEEGFSVDIIEHSVWLPKSRVGMARIKATKKSGLHSIFGKAYKAFK